MTAPYASIGYTREDGEFRILATLNNADEEMTEADFTALAAAVAARLHEAMRDDLGEIPTLEILSRQDTPDYVDLDEEEQAALTTDIRSEGRPS